MFGYILPNRKKLDESDWQAYHAIYCGLCHTLKARYGFMARFLLNYDFTFLAALLTEKPNQQCYCSRCISSPLNGRKCQQQDLSMEKAADATILLFYFKLKDQIADGTFMERLGARFLTILFYLQYRKAKKFNSKLSSDIQDCLIELSLLEKQNCSSIDQTADCFARLMVLLIPEQYETKRKRLLTEILYHLGRWIYIIDALDDLYEDQKRNSYNPILSRYQIKNAEDERIEEVKLDVINTLLHSENLCISAFHLTDFGFASAIIENVLCAGMPMVRNLVSAGEWKHIKHSKRQELNKYE